MFGKRVLLNVDNVLAVYSENTVKGALNWPKLLTLLNDIFT